jgi:hypothetical protein
VRIKVKRLTSFPVSLKGLQEESFHFALVKPSYIRGRPDERVHFCCSQRVHLQTAS